MQLPLSTLDIPRAPEEASLAPAARIYSSRNLRLDQIEMIGFDMDYTLAIYNQEGMDRLSIEATVQKLVLERGYPESLLSMDYRIDFPIRGLLVDKKYGNILKMDRYKYVKKAYHGLHPLDTETRRKLYHAQQIKPATSRYHWVDTLYALSEVSVYAATVEELERRGMEVNYEKLFTDVRECIDLSHQDGSILDKVLADLPKYVVRDPKLGPTLHKLRSSGKRLFLLTNSRAGYTNEMMKYLLDGSVPGYPSWKNFFEYTITASKKPRFFDTPTNFRRVNDDGTETEVETLERGGVYAGGNLLDFERIAGVDADRILYVGDHIFGDVLRAKKETAWRTAMIIQEMSAELEALHRSAADSARLDSLTDLRGTLHHDLRVQQERLKRIMKSLDSHKETNGGSVPPEVEADRVKTRKTVEKLRAQIKVTETEMNEIEERIDRAFHPFWGSLFKAGPETSSFGNQVEMYACVYMDRVSNLLDYSPYHYFRSPRDRMPHET
jgi:5'-nucleotidase